MRPLRCKWLYGNAKGRTPQPREGCHVRAAPVGRHEYAPVDDLESVTEDIRKQIVRIRCYLLQNACSLTAYFELHLIRASLITWTIA